MGVICSSFGCLPSQALNENPQTIFAILEHRIASSTKDQFNKDASKIPEENAKLWKEIVFEMTERGHGK